MNEKKYSIKCKKCRKLKNSKISCIFNDTLVLFIICDTCGGNNNTIIKKVNKSKWVKYIVLNAKVSRTPNRYDRKI